MTGPFTDAYLYETFQMWASADPSIAIWWKGMLERHHGDEAAAWLEAQDMSIYKVAEMLDAQLRKTTGTERKARRAPTALSGGRL